jgi:Mrp family chromosome partitioning ATPase
LNPTRRDSHLIKSDLLTTQVRFTRNRRRATSLLRSLRRSLGQPRTALFIQELRDRIHFRAQRKVGSPSTGCTIGISAANGGEETSALSLILAVGLSELNRNKILVVDGAFDGQNFQFYEELLKLRKVPFDLDESFGYLKLYSPENSNLYFLGGSPTVGAMDFFSSGELGRFLQRLKEAFNYVIFDMPPVRRASETRMLLPLVDFFYLVTVARKTTIQDIEYCKALSKEANKPIDGVILNRQYIPFWTRFIGREYYF